MTNPERFTSVAGQADDLQSLHERISELDEQISGFRRLEETLLRNNRLFQALLAASQDGIVLTSTDGSIIRVVKSILGYNRSGFPIFDVLHPDDQATMREFYDQIKKRRIPQFHYELRALKADGSSVWIEGTATDMLDDPNVLGIVHNFRNVTARKQAEFAGLELAAVIEQIPFAFFSKDLEGNIRSWNAGAERTFGYTEAEIIGRHIWNIVPAEFQHDEAALRNRVIEGSAPVGPIRVVRAHKDGTHVSVQLTLAPLIKDGCVRGFLHLSHT